MFRFFRTHSHKHLSANKSCTRIRKTTEWVILLLRDELFEQQNLSALFPNKALRIWSISRILQHTCTIISALICQIWIKQVINTLFLIQISIQNPKKWEELYFIFRSGQTRSPGPAQKYRLFVNQGSLQVTESASSSADRKYINFHADSLNLLIFFLSSRPLIFTTVFFPKIMRLANA